MIPRIFEGQPVVIVAGGPSLAGFSWSRLAGLNVIAINRAYENVPGAQVLWWSDARFWRNHQAGLTRHKAPWKATCAVNYHAGDALPVYIHQYAFTRVDGFDPNPAYLRTGNNSAYAATHLAAHLGTNRIVLLGVDMRHGERGETHFHGGHGCLHQESTLSRLMVPHFATLAGPLAERGIEVINASPNSALVLWPRCTIDEGLASIRQSSSEPPPRLRAGSM